MTGRPDTFLDLSPPLSEPDGAAVHIMPLPYEGAVSYGRGAALGPAAVIDASTQVELYDETTRDEPCRAGIATLRAPELPEEPARMAAAVEQDIREHLAANDALLACIGGDHSVTVPHVRALCGVHQPLSVIQFDAHADLRDEYMGSPMNHACVMKRVREHTPHTLQIGIRSLCAEEARYIEAEAAPLCTARALRSGEFDLDAALDSLPDPVFITLDVDVLDWSVVTSTGTPEPGGLTWDEILDLLGRLFASKRVIGFDVVELAGGPGSRNSAFAVARLVYKMIGLHIRYTREYLPHA